MNSKQISDALRRLRDTMVDQADLADLDSLRDEIHRRISPFAARLGVIGAAIIFFAAGAVAGDVLNLVSGDCVRAPAAATESSAAN